MTTHFQGRGEEWAELNLHTPICLRGRESFFLFYFTINLPILWILFPDKLTSLLKNSHHKISPPNHIKYQHILNKGNEYLSRVGIGEFRRKLTVWPKTEISDIRCAQTLFILILHISIAWQLPPLQLRLTPKLRTLGPLFTIVVMGLYTYLSAATTKKN
jgi:hypothetical protein